MSLNERVKYATMKARHQKKLRPWYKKPWGIIIIIIVTIFLIFSFVLAIKVVQILQGKDVKINDNTSPEEIAAQYLNIINRSSANTLGPVNAPITIIEFGDFACSFCQDSYFSLKNIREKYPNQVRIVYRDLPLHDNSIFLALSARCAGEQGQFWKMHDLFFENQDQFNVNQQELKIVMPEIATALELDVDKFNTCLNEEKYFKQIEQDVEDASILEIEGSPTWFINNAPFTGHLPVNTLEDLVSALINLPENNK